MIMTKTPYEVRLDVLTLAQNMLEAERQRASIDYNTMLKGSMSYPSEVMAAAKSRAQYTDADVKTKAESMYSFVTDTSNRSKNVK